jgi:hypothetical protein
VQGGGAATLTLTPVSTSGTLVFNGSGAVLKGFTILSTATPTAGVQVLIGVYGNNVTIADCTIRDIPGQTLDDEIVIQVIASQCTFTNLFFRNINDRDLFRAWGAYNKWTSCTFSNCNNPNYGPSHADIIQTWWIGQLVKSNVFENCYFVDCNQATFQLKGTPDNINCNPGAEGYWTIRNCIFKNCASWPVISTDQFRFYNNLLYVCGTGSYNLFLNSGPCNTGGRYYNNVLINTYCQTGSNPSYRNNAFSAADASFGGTGDFVTTEAACKFVNAAAGNFRLQAGSSLIGKGINLASDASMTTIDADGKARPASGAWDVGPYQYATAGPVTNASLSVSPSSLDFGSVTVGATSDLTFTVQNTGGGTLSGTASVSVPFSIIAGGTYSLGANQSQTVTVRFSPTAVGSTNRIVTFTGGGGATAIVSGVQVSPPIPGSLSFEAEAGSVTAPFVVASGYIYQTSETSVTAGGRAIYNFTITNAGEYVIQATVNAPNDAANSFFVNIDAEPQDPSMIWQIPVTTGFESRIVNAQGNGTFDNPQFDRKIFNLTTGSHQLIIRGREANTQLDRLSLVKLVAPPSNVMVVFAP